MTGIGIALLGMVLSSGAAVASARDAVGRAEMTTCVSDRGAANPTGYRVLGWAVYAASAGDLLSTELVLAQGGAVERNPLMRNRAVRIGAKSAGTVFLLYATEELRRRGHPRVALAMRIAAVAAYGYATAHNLRLRR